MVAPTRALAILLLVALLGTGAPFHPGPPAGLPPGAPPRGAAAAPSLPAPGSLVGPQPSVTATWAVATREMDAGNTIPGDGLGPSAVAVDGTTDRAFVTNGISPFLTVMNASSGTLTTYLRLRDAGATAVLAFGGLVYVAEPSGVVQVANASRDAIVANVSVAGDPLSLALDGTGGRVFVGNGSGWVDVLAISSLTRSGGFATGLSANALAYDPVRDRLLEAGGFGSAATIVNATTGTPTANLTLGIEPQSAIFDPLTQAFYVGNLITRNISVVNASSERSDGSWALGTGVLGLVTTPDGRWIFASGGPADNITRINATAASDRRSFPVPAYSQGLAYDAATSEILDATDRPIVLLNATDGNVTASLETQVGLRGAVADAATQEIFASDDYAGVVHVWNLSTNASAPDIAVGLDPSALELDPVSGRLFVYNVGDGSVSVIDPPTGTLVATLHAGFGIDGMTVLGDRGEIALSFLNPQGAPEMEILSSATVQVLRSFAVGELGPLSYCAAAQELLLAGGLFGSTLQALDPIDGHVNATGTVGGNPYSIACDPISGRVFAANYLTGNVSVLNGTTLAPVASLAVGGLPTGLALDAEDGVVYVTNAATNSVTAIGGGNLTTVAQLAVGIDPLQPSFDPGTRRLYLPNYESGSVSVIDPHEPLPTLGTVTVSPTSVTLGAGQVATFSAEARNSLGALITSGAVYDWTLTNPVAGTLTATTGSSVGLDAGSSNASARLWVNVTYGSSNGGTFATVVVSVASGTFTLASVSLAPSTVNVGVGTMQPLAATVARTGGGPPPAGTTVAWAVRPASLGTLNSSSGDLVTFTAVSAGSGVVNVTATYGSSTVYAEGAVVVTSAPPPSLGRVVPTAASLALGFGASAGEFVSAFDSSGANVTNATFFSWSTTSASIGNLSAGHGPAATLIAGSVNASGLLEISIRYGGESRVLSVPVTVASANGRGPPQGTAPTGAPAFELLGVPWWLWVGLLGAGAAAIAGAAPWRRPPRPGSSAG